MRIIHCADLHLDSKMNSFLSKEKAVERRNELLITFQNMLKYAVKNGVSAIIIAGDLFDTNHISSKCKNIVMGAIRDYSSINFYYLKGNHDQDDFLFDVETLPDNLYMFDNTWTSYSLTKMQGRNIVLSGVELNKENSNLIYSSLVLDYNNFNIVTLHGQESEHDARDKTEIIGLRLLRNKNIDYLALGHIHQYKMEKLDARGHYCYPGCLEGRGFDECGVHGFVLLDINEEEWSYECSFIPFSSRTIYSEEVDISDCLNTLDIEKAIQKHLNIAGISKESLVKIILTGHVEVDCEKDLSYLVSKFSNDYYYVKIYDETGIKINYDDFLLDASLKGEFVRTVKDEDIDEELKAKIIQLGLHALSGGEL